MRAPDAHDEVLLPATMRLLVQQNAGGDSAHVLLRSKLRAVSRRMNFPDTTRDAMELVCNEMVSNQAKFAGGSGLVQLWETGGSPPALDLFALDYGPGLRSVDEAIADGYTTVGTMGKGLGAIKRLAHESEIYSVPEEGVMDTPWHGVAVWARFYREIPRQRSAVETGIYLRAYQDGMYNGDCVLVHPGANGLDWVHIDALGHGREAAEVFEHVTGSLGPHDSTVDMVNALSAELEGGRGAVALAGRLDLASKQVHLAGIGDLDAYVILNGERRAISFPPGVLGHAHRAPQVQSQPFPPQALMVSASDGLRRSWGLASFPSLWRLHPQLIAFVLGTVAGRSSDDKSVYVVRTAPETGRS